MKRSLDSEVKADQVTAKPEKKVKREKSVNFSKNVDIKVIPSNKENKKAEKKLKKKEKRSKFEKPVIANKIEKLEKIKIKKAGKQSEKKDKLSSKKNKEPHKDAKNMETLQSGEKPDWKELRKQRKELKEQRRAKKLTDSYDICIKAKQLSEKLRRADCPELERKKLTGELHELLKSQYVKLVFTHDMSRIIQWQFKYCSPENRQSIVTQLKPVFIQMFESKYARKVVGTILSIVTDDNNIKKDIIETCYGNVLRLLSHSIAAPLFEKIYVEMATSNQQKELKQEFYGNMYKNSKDPNVKTILDVYKDADHMKKATLTFIKANLVKILNKKLINSTLLHTILFEFLTNCSKDDRNEIIVMVRSIISELSQTKHGAKAGAICIWHGTTKDRKVIMKTLKENIKDMFISEHGHLMILALLDTVDDTVLLNKIILSEMISEENIIEIASSEYGRRVILYLVARRDRHYFHPDLVEYLKKGDGNETSKKPAEIRSKEILDSVIDSLLASITNNTDAWLSDSKIQMVTLAILKASTDIKHKSAYDSIAKFITNKDSKIIVNDVSHNAVEHAGLHMILKKIITFDCERAEKKEVTFGEVLLEHLTNDVIKNWIEINRGCFLLVLLLENEPKDIVQLLRTKLNKVQNELKAKDSKGARILIEVLEKC